MSNASRLDHRGQGSQGNRELSGGGGDSSSSEPSSDERELNVQDEGEDGIVLTKKAKRSDLDNRQGMRRTRSTSFQDQSPEMHTNHIDDLTSLLLNSSTKFVDANVLRKHLLPGILNDTSIINSKFESYLGWVIIFDWVEAGYVSVDSDESHSELTSLSRLSMLLHSASIERVFALSYEVRLRERYYFPVLRNTDGSKTWWPSLDSIKSREVDLQRRPSIFDSSLHGVTMSGTVDVKVFDYLKADEKKRYLNTARMIYVETFSKDRLSSSDADNSDENKILMERFKELVQDPLETANRRTHFIAILFDPTKLPIGFVHIEEREGRRSHGIHSSTDLPLIFIGEIAVIPSYQCCGAGKLLVLEALWSIFCLCLKNSNSSEFASHIEDSEIENRINTTEASFYGWVSNTNSVAQKFYMSFGAKIRTPASGPDNGIASSSTSESVLTDLSSHPGRHGYDGETHTCFVRRINGRELRSLVASVCDIVKERLVRSPRNPSFDAHVSA